MIDVLGFIIVGFVIAWCLLYAWLFVVSLFPSNQVRSNHGNHRCPEEDHPHPDPPEPVRTFTLPRPWSRARQDTGYEVIDEEIPILAHRMARLVVTPAGHPVFQSLFRPDLWGREAVSRCPRSMHRAPAASCTCGWWCVPVDVKIVCPYPQCVELLVELAGTVVEHEWGFRAEHQRVVECRLPAGFRGPSPETLAAALGVAVTS